MTAEVIDGPFARTHDVAQAALRGECDRLGARVTFTRAAHAGERTRRYEIALDRVGSEPFTSASLYSLPVRLADLVTHVQNAVKGAAGFAERTT